MALDFSAIFADMLSAAEKTAGQQWVQVKKAVSFELRTLAQRLVQIVDLRTSGEIDEDDATLFFTMGRNNCVAAIAMATALVAAAVKKIVDAALNVVKTAVNSAIGFPLI